MVFDLFKTILFSTYTFVSSPYLSLFNKLLITQISRIEAFPWPLSRIGNLR